MYLEDEAVVKAGDYLALGMEEGCRDGESESGMEFLGCCLLSGGEVGVVGFCDC